MDGLGELLKSERLNTKLNIKEVSNKTNIPEKIIKALESNDYSKIPGKFYLKNFIKNYLSAMDIDYKEFLLKHKDNIDNIPFNVDKKNDYLYKMRYSKFEKKGVFIKVLLVITIIVGGYYAVYQNLDIIKKYLTPEKIIKIKNIPNTRLNLENQLGLIYYGFEKIKNNNSSILNEQFNFSDDKWAVNLVIIINKKNWITIFQDGKKLIGRDFNQGEIIQLKGYSFFLHTQFASAIDVLINGKELKYFKGKKGYQKLMILPDTMD